LFPDATANTTLRAATVDDMLDVLDERWPGMRDRLADTSPAIRRHISIFVNGQRATLTTALPDGDDVYILTAMSGG
ncbi:MAG: MoaD/ThiS family protein, partial [Alphaproteobacteria bacterium]|nr:MoaD/ThiS family protein [Alphaproteobacteria bacterium]